jgi:glucose dehydrogenase
MVNRLCRPSRGRLALWMALTTLWLLILVQALAMQPISRTSIPGAIFWALVQVWLIWMATMTWRRRRAARC